MRNERFLPVLTQQDLDRMDSILAAMHIPHRVNALRSAILAEAQDLKKSPHLWKHGEPLADGLKREKFHAWLSEEELAAVILIKERYQLESKSAAARVAIREHLRRLKD